MYTYSITYTCIYACRSSNIYCNMRHTHYDVQLSYPSQTAGIRMYNKDILDHFYWQPGGPPCSAGPSGMV